jgi:hypothetical protein
MSKKLEVINGTFTITDTVTGKVDFRSLSAETFLNSFLGKYYFYYDIFIKDNIRRTRSVDYLLNELIDSGERPFITSEELIDWVSTNLGSSKLSVKEVTDYRSEFDFVTKYIYSGYNLDGIPAIIRYKAGGVEQATGVTNLTTDWNNRVTLTYIYSN